ncbi:glucosamine-6-phosphate deaminase [uncultured Pseudoteredinibacter sp.]|uniref:glucosamine-6-phosphate deaminase n=1 Tax=uncultured Pseudoteredinibacter sp. TaxID=1641701 RepID=UPI002611FEB6|nr:glucosamine-6-phosphate deaminase [uncultured Pseudoteredinibacter sp.]
MKVVILKTEDEVAQYSADFISHSVTTNKNAVLGLATGSSPIACYQKLIQAHQRAQLSFKHCTTFNLDEYIGICPDNDQSYRQFMNEQLYKHIDIPLLNTHIPNGSSSDLEHEAKCYEDKIKAFGGIDLQLLGIGRNCHIGFNEPGSSLSSRTRVKSLSNDTILANSRFFKPEEFQPSSALTMGIGTILEAKKILLIATGEQKALAIKHCVEGPISAFFPASALQQHADSTIVIDEAAAQLLSSRDYYMLEEDRRKQAS